MIKRYSNGQITIVWRPERCIHSGICVRALPQVFRPSEHPWIRTEFAGTSELIAAVDRCPSAALTYERKTVFG